MSQANIMWLLQYRVKSKKEPITVVKTVGGVCNFLGSVPLQQKFEATDGAVLQPHVIAQFYLESKGKYIFEVSGEGLTQELGREEKPPDPILAPLLIYSFLLSLGLPYVNWASQEAVCFT